jgi:hypothetical protein
VACPLQAGLTVMGSINIIDPTSYAYADKGVAVQSSALESPAGIYDSDGAFGFSLADLLGQYATSALSTQQCVPVMFSKPYSCRAGGNITVNSTSNAVFVTSKDGM